MRKVSRPRTRDRDRNRSRPRRDLRRSRPRLKKTGLETRLETETKSLDSITVFFFQMLCSELIFHFLAFILSYHLNLSLFEAFQFHARTSHPLKKVPLEKSGSLYLGDLFSPPSSIFFLRTM